MQINVHQENYKKNDISGIEKEQKRLSKEYKNDVVSELTKYNKIINYESNNSWKTIINERVKTHENITGKKIRKDAVLFASIVESVPKSWESNPALIDQYFDMQNNSVFELLKKHGMDENTRLSSITHYDETTPHNTFTFMPIKDGKFNRKAIFKRELFGEIQQLRWNNYLEFSKQHPELEKLDERVEGNGRKHMTEQKYKIAQLEKEVSVQLDTISKQEEIIENLTETINAINDYHDGLCNDLDKIKLDDSLNNQLTLLTDKEMNDIINAPYKVTDKGFVRNITSQLWRLVRSYFNVILQIKDKIKVLEKELNEIKPTLNKAKEISKEYKRSKPVIKEKNNDER